MKTHHFPWSLFIIGSAVMLSLSMWLLLYVMQQTAKAEIEHTFTSLTERVRGEFATIIALESGLVANTLTLNNIENHADRELNLYIQLLNNERDDVNFFILPKITSDMLEQYEQEKQDNGYLDFRVFGNADTDPLNSTHIYFPSETIKQNKLSGLKHFGRDVYSYPNFKDAMDEASVKNKTVAAWSHVTAENTHGITIFHPIYDTQFFNTLPENTKMDHVQAMVASEIFLDDLIKNIINRLDIEDMSFYISVQSYRAIKQARTTTIPFFITEAADWLPEVYHSQTIALLDKPVTISMKALIPLNKLSWIRAFVVFFVTLVLIALSYLFIKHYLKNKHEKDIADAMLEKEHNRADATLTALGEGVITTDTLGTVMYLNPKARDILGENASNLPLEGKLLTALYPASLQTEAQKIMDSMLICIEKNQIVQLHNIKAINHHGTPILIDCTLSPMVEEAGNISGVALVLEDVTYLEEMRLQIENMAKRDHLTGLFNRYEFENQLKDTIINAHKHKLTHAFCYLDLDQFKIVNDTAGHLAGDQLLRQLSGTVFLRSTPAGAILGRLGGDEFGLLLFNTDIKKATKVCEQIIHDIQHFVFLWQDKRFQVGVSIGLVMIDDLSLSVEQSLISADTACYLAKEKGRNRVESAHIDNEEVRQRQEELSWAERLPRAIEENRLVLFIQYMLPLNGVRTHAEILVRMKDEQGKLLAPNQFIPAAERYGIMTKIDRWIIQRSLENIEQIISRKGDEGFIYSINLSGQTLTDETFLRFIHDALSKRKALAERICFEITETATMGNLVQALRCMKLLKDLGASLALDDFGSGLSSFAYLRQMPVDYLKIDGAFVHNIHKDGINRAIVANMHQLAGVFGLKTIAEYAENESIISELKKIGVDLAQGYGFHVPEEWIVEILRAEQSRAEQSRAEQSRAEQSRAEQSNYTIRLDLD
jgi:diguanylate cyclase (GGDEF)-like protein/PAS domain S-box-containing protein